MKVRALSSFSLGGGRDVLEGEVFLLEDRDASLKIAAGKVVPVPEVPLEVERASGPDVAPDVLAASDPIPNHREPRRPRPR